MEYGKLRKNIMDEKERSVHLLYLSKYPINNFIFRYSFMIRNLKQERCEVKIR